MRGLLLLLSTALLFGLGVAEESVNPTGPEGPPPVAYRFSQKTKSNSFAGFEFFATSVNQIPSPLSKTQFPEINFKIYEMSSRVLRLSGNPLGFPGTPPYKIPSSVFPNIYDEPQTGPATSDFRVEVDDINAKFEVYHKKTGAVLFELSGGPDDDSFFSYQDKYLSFNLPLKSSQPTYIYGFGEHNFDYFLNKNATSDTKLSVWNTDNFGLPWGDPLYGVHPVIYVAVPGIPLFYAVAIVNSHTQTLHIPTGADRMRYTAIGGALDLYIISGETPLEVVSEWYKIINQPEPASNNQQNKFGGHIPPYWSLGTHQSRWGYRNISVLKGVVNGYEKAGLPLEALWTDINVMDKFRIFTTDPVLFPQEELKDFVKTYLHDTSRKYVQIVDPGVAYVPDGSYGVYNDGLKEDVYIKWKNPFEGNATQNLINWVWPGETVFPDFSSMKVQAWWNKQLTEYRKSIPIDGVWLDMNEIASFCPGGCSALPVPPDSHGGSSESSLQSKSSASSEIPPATTPSPAAESSSGFYEDSESNADQSLLGDRREAIRHNLGSEQPHPDCSLCGPNPFSTLDQPLWPETPALLLPQQHNLTTKTIDMTADLEMGKYYDTKAFYGMLECEATFKSMLNQTGKRPFLLSRSTFAGSGRYTAHWTGDGIATFEPKHGGLPDTIQSTLAANLWGVPMVGADIGGYAFNATEDLVVRWNQVGAYYAFMRNHHWDEGYDQGPYLWSKDAVAAMRIAMLRRYHLLPYLFTALVNSAYKGLPVLRHLSLQFPFEIATYKESYNFMFGPSILVIPFVLQGQNQTTDVYLPGTAPWFEIWSGKAAGPGQTLYSTPVPERKYNDVPALVQSGSVIPLHTNALMTVEATRASGVSLLVALNPSTNYAEGEVLLDDGEDHPLSQLNMNQDITVVSYAAAGTFESGSLSATRDLAKNSRPRASSSSTSSNITLLFWRAHTNRNGGALSTSDLVQKNTVFSVILNGSITLEFGTHFTVENATVPTPNNEYLQTLILKVTYPGMDVRSEFDLKWGFAPVTTTSAPTGAPSPTTPSTTPVTTMTSEPTSPTPSSTPTTTPPGAGAPADPYKKKYSAMVALVVVFGIVMGGGIVIFIFAKFKKSRSSGGWQSYDQLNN